MKLGRIEIEAIDQPWYFLVEELRGVGLEAFEHLDGIESTEDFVRFIGGGMYEVLTAFYPDYLPSQMPRHEFECFATQTAYEAGQYDREWARKNGPSFPQIVQALDAGIKANGGEDFRMLIGLVPPKLRELGQALIREKIADLASRSTSSPNSPPTSGESDPTSSGDEAPHVDGTTAESPSLV